MEISDDLFRQAKKRAADEGVPMRAIVETALRRFLLRPGKQGSYRLRWHPEEGRLQPGVRLEDRDALFDLMDGRR